ncbi:MAG: helix-turn-helix domain-containing protein [Capnocytophaga sp.]|nr:helix-turn-helix domain-containing protein [Capnocytophaga sp.]
MLYQIQPIKTEDFQEGKRLPMYYIFLLQGEGNFSLDFVTYSFSGNNLLFLSPYQWLKWEKPFTEIQSIAFHGDFYCIEYHKEEVACNGLLFNNIYQSPCVECSENIFTEIQEIIQKMQRLNPHQNALDTSILKTYLQLILALSSREKKQKLTEFSLKSTPTEPIANFQNLLETHFIKNKEVSFYAGQYALSVSAFSKKVKQYFGKTPSELIRERMVLEAKKLLHLTYKSIKEIAQELDFEDEFYFSRYFKKEVGLSPKQFRDSVGISIVAK